MALRRCAVHGLICSGLLFCIIHLGLLFSFPPVYYDPSSTRRKFQVQYRYVDPIPKTLQEQVVTKNIIQYHNKQVKKAIHHHQLTFHDNLEPIPRPSLASLVDGWNITGDVSWLIQFSIIGFPKSGTSTLMFHLRDHPEIHMFPHERCELSSNRQKILIEDMYRQFPPSSTLPLHRYVRGIKCPMELENRQLALHNYQKYFPKTDFIVGIRHPILWFESFYNFRLQNKFPMPPAETLIGRCRKGWNNVCTNRANFHVFLSNLGKTNITTNMEEMGYVDIPLRQAIDPIRTNRQVFLYEVSQLSDQDTKRSVQLRQDLQHFLHLQQPIPPFIWYKPGQNRTTDHNHAPTAHSNKIDICDGRYNAIRAILLHHSKQASRWIRKYFIHAEGVIVSSKPYFENNVLPLWEVDPCIERKKS